MSSLSGTQPGPDVQPNGMPGAGAGASETAGVSAAHADATQPNGAVRPGPLRMEASAAAMPLAAGAAAAPAVSPQALLHKAQAGDRQAYGQIILLYQDRLYNAVLRLVGDRDEALELTQEAFTRGLLKLDSFRGDAQPYTWLFRIAVNLAISQLRKTRRNRVFSLDRPSGPAAGNGRYGGDADDQASGLLDRVSQAQDRAREPSPAERVEQRERNEIVLAALGRLDAEYRAVLVMRDVEGFDYQQMADILGLPLGTLKSRLFRARMALRDELKPYLKDERSEVRGQRSGEDEADEDAA